MSGRPGQIIFVNRDRKNPGSRERTIDLVRLAFILGAVVYLGIAFFLGQKPWFGYFRLFLWGTIAVIFIPLTVSMIFLGRKR